MWDLECCQWSSRLWDCNVRGPKRISLLVKPGFCKRNPIPGRKNLDNKHYNPNEGCPFGVAFFVDFCYKLFQHPVPRPFPRWIGDALRAFFHEAPFTFTPFGFHAQIFGSNIDCLSWLEGCPHLHLAIGTMSSHYPSSYAHPMLLNNPVSLFHRPLLAKVRWPNLTPDSPNLPPIGQLASRCTIVGPAGADHAATLN